MKRSRKADGGHTEAELKKPPKRARGKKAESLAPSIPGEEIVKSTDATSPAHTTASKQLKKPVKTARAPVDETCWFSAKSKGIAKDCYEVYVDDDGLNYDASLNLSSIDGNNNKFYYIQLLCRTDTDQSKFAVWTHWGRVGEAGQNNLNVNMSLETALVLFKSKFKDKTGLKWENRSEQPKAKKYTMIEKSYGNETDDEAGDQAQQSNESPQKIALPDCTLNEELQELVRFLFDTGNMKKSMASQKYNFNKLPLGKLSKSTIEKGYLALRELGDVILNPKLAQEKHETSLVTAFNDLSSQYYTIIPHDFGRNRPTPINSSAQLKAEMDLVETLGNMQISNEILKDTEYPKDRQGNAIHPLDAQMRSLGLREAIPVDRKSVEFGHLESYLNHAKDGYCLSSDTAIQNIYRISRSEEIDRWFAGGYDAEAMKTKLVKDHRRLLWHGSRGCNFGGILSQGLRIAPPEAPANGKAFGKGIYLADRACKSAAYCDPWTSGQTGLLLLCETQLGDPAYVRRDHEYNAADSMRKKGLISTKMAENPANEPLKWMDAGVANSELNGTLMPDHEVKLPSARGNPNEYIVYDVAQIKIRYVFMLKWKDSRQWGIY
ncbi:hypothetical protein HO133_001898 [Letharia lupina]|uniref:Poly [ADP-ribose] polymerase n=1 Tax=Letharia lupina TaxID=560253 RepID=A0A8H6FB60_9LECA|nr:uncharacterized protein HO133_001898 [Letharia lupina]KAF6221930.1 hypothetical protein HO133_001898 [Letharia lupina]